MIRRGARWLALLLTLAGVGTATADYRDHLVQEPELAAPERGSIAGTYAAWNVGATELSRGSFDLPGPFEAPETRGPRLAEVFPSYAPDAGLDVFGLGWRTALRVVRHRDVGAVDYSTDDALATPWGIAERGDDGRYLVRGAGDAVVVTTQGASLVARTPSGETHRFAPAFVTDEGTFEWHLVEVQSAEGDRTELSWEANASGRTFLREVAWGGRGIERLTARVRLEYETIASPLVDYRAGAPRVLDRRVVRLHVESFDGSTGAFAPRWHYDLAYEEHTATFFLASVTRTFASGAVEPAHVFSYERADDAFADASLHRVTALDAYLGAVGSEGVQPTGAAFFDVDLDGRIDLEHHYGQTLVQHTDTGYVYRTLPRTGREDARCRPRPSWNNEPRRLVRVRPVHDDEHQVVVAEPASAFGGTALTICDRPGFVLHQQSLDGEWTPGRNVRLVDVDQDRDPDFVRVWTGGMQILRNVSTEDTIAFEEEAPTTLALGYEPRASWLHDMNGDGVVDLVTRHDSGLDVWFGRGRGRFEEEALALSFVAEDGTVLAALDKFELVFTDANRDGLEDVLLAAPGAVHLFTNRGTHFGAVAVPGLTEVGWDVGLPVAVDLEGRGEEQAVFVDGRSAWAVTLSQPGANLLARAEDGRGGVVSFRYRRSRPTPGIQHRPPMLEELRVEGVGLAPLVTRYDYEEARFHSSGLHLLGFGLVRLATPETLEEARFDHDDARGLMTEVRGADGRRPGLWRVDAHGYEDLELTGVPRSLHRASAREWRRDVDGASIAGTRVENEAYEGLCPVRTRHATPHGTLVVTTRLAQVPAYEGAHACLAANEAVVGTHPGRAELDFASATSIERDAAGRVTRVTSEGNGLPLHVQGAAYDAAGRVAELRSAAGGVQRFEWNGGRLDAVVDADGVRHVVRVRDARTDAIATLSVERGTSRFDQHFRYDTQERLAARWSNVGGASAAQPAEAYAYTFASEGQPGSVAIRTLVDASAGAYRQLAELQTSSGSVLATATRTETGWGFGAIDVEEREEGRVDTYARAPLEGDVEAHAITMADLLDESALALRERRWTSPFEDVRASERVVNAGVVRHESSELSLEAEGLVLRTTVAGAYTSATVRDGDGRIVRTTDAGGAQTSRSYDALGRLVEVTLPDGRAQSLRYDAHGRVASVRHEGVGAIASSYHATRGVLVGKTFFGRDGAAERQVRYEHDGLGRVVAERHVRLSDGQERRHDFAYDGVGSAAPNGQLGHRTGTSTPGYARSSRHRADGLVDREVVELDGWRRVELEHRYAADGTLRGATRVVRDGAGRELVRVTRETAYDAWGRPSVVTLDGQPLATLHYDGDGRVDHVELPSGDLVFEHDPVTREQVGYTYATSDWTVSYGTQRDTRGHVAHERIEHAHGESAVQEADRTHVRDARGFVVEGGDARYTYADDGLPASANDLAGARDFEREGDVLQAGDVTYRFDSQGRVVARDDARFEYGPDGHLARAFVGDRALDYVYDDAGQRVLKRVDGAPVAGFVDGAVVTEDTFVEPIRVAGLVVGVLENGRFRAVATDGRGSVLADGAGFHDATPYGWRAAHPANAIALDYAAKGWDPDLETVRMGVRDYDPYLARFWTPDPLFAEDLERCGESPVECSLYGYVGNDPVEFVDPEGTERESVNRIKEERVKQRTAELQAGNAGAAMGLINDFQALTQLDDSMDTGALRRAMFNFFTGSDMGLAFLFARDAGSFSPAIGHYSTAGFPVVGHGGPGTFALKGRAIDGNDHWLRLTASQVVDLAKEEGFDPKKNFLMLSSCNGATAPAGGTSFAQKLADASGVPVVAANDFTWHGSGGVRPGHYINGTNGGGPFDTSGTFVPGAWVIFVPTPKGP
ncbi:MAG: hypothetical protein H6721_03840 [Sandaracinus sp.]|nr:hypothetical protein [Sandaracinus sp.]MCB9631261.1 hypothetical protein [Sandaracinus sp.]